MILAGIDEAGYGPMLGPMVVSAAVFRVPGDEGPPDLWERLAPAVGRSTKARAIPVNDSKKLFHQGRGLVHLEEGVLPFLLHRHGRAPESLRSLLEHVARRGGGRAAAYLDAYPWYRNRDLKLPRDTFKPVLRRLAGRLGERLSATSIEFLALAAVPVEVHEFNERLQALDNKSKVSFQAISHILQRIWKQFAAETTEVVVDRLGGRTHYGPLLFEALKPRGIHIDEQGSDRSGYRLTRRGRRADRPTFRVSFSTESEEKHLPVALASMLSKYLRELHMALFNEYWTELQTGLKPTAGYVTDARRFLSDTSALRERLGTDEWLLVRNR